MSNQTTGASSNMRLKRLPSKKPPSAFVSSRAAPLDEDDFELEAAADAEQYADRQRMESRRDKVRQQNITRKKEGLRPLRLPPAWKPDRSSSGRKRRQSFSESDYGSETEDVRYSGIPDYEGQVLLPFNPLERLADPAYTSDGWDAKAADIGMKQVTAKETEPDHERPAAHQLSKGQEMSQTQSMEFEDESYEDDDDYDEQDLVVSVPWMVSDPPVNESSEPEDGDEEEEDYYSEDERFNLSLPSTFPSQTSRGSVEDGIVQERPGFACTPDQLAIAAYKLDPNDPGIVIPAPINRFLRDYQRAGVSFLYRKYKNGYGGILGDDMGLGKTVQVISFLSAIMRKTGKKTDYRRRKNLIRHSEQSLAPQTWPTAIIVCPKSLIPNWERELNTWGYFEFAIWKSDTAEDVAKSMKAGYLDLVLISPDPMVRFVDELKRLPFSVLIVDEAHRLKNPLGKLSLAVKKLPVKSCFALTGTLMQNRMEEMWSVLDFVHRGWAGTFQQWKQFAVVPIKLGHRFDGTIQELVEGIKRIGDLHEHVLPHFYLRRDKRLIAKELPEKRDHVILCPLGSRQAVVYKRIIDSEDVAFVLQSGNDCECGSGLRRRECCHERNSMGDSHAAAMLKLFSILGKVSNHLALTYQSEDSSARAAIDRRTFKFCMGEEFDPAVHRVVEAMTDPVNCGKWTLLEKLLQDWRSRPEENNKVLVFSNSVRLLKMLQDFLTMSETLSGFDCDLLCGEVKEEDRMAMVDRFQDPQRDKNFVMLISTMAGGVGLNLTAANKVVIFDPNWNPANDLQAMDRAFRIGQKRPVDVYRLISKGTIEELMYERQVHKQQRARQLNDGTHEPRTHKGFDGGVGKKDQGELFGVQNIFRYDPNGYFEANMERQRETEVQMRQDFLDVDYDQEMADDDDDDDMDDEAKAMIAHRRAKAIKRAATEQQATEQSLLSELLSEGSNNGSALKPNSDGNLLESLGITPFLHENAFKDSVEERQAYERGLKLIQENPKWRDFAANNIGKLKIRAQPRATKKRKSTAQSAEAPAHDDEAPWQSRFARGRPTGRALVSADESD